MSLTRKLLESMGLDADKITSIIDAHVETVDALKEKNATQETKLKELSEKEAQYLETKKELEKLKANGGDWQKKYEDEHNAFETYKNKQVEIEAARAKESAYRALLVSAGVSEKRIPSILKVADLNSIEYADGKIKDTEKVTESIKEEWADFITQTNSSGVSTKTPPENGGGKIYASSDIKKMSVNEINKNWADISASLKGEQ
nr:MAG TPA: minor structural protein [Caudoviricetes sp.]